MLPTIATGNVGSALAEEYEVANSLRFNDDSSDTLTLAEVDPAGNRKTFTLSVWVKRCVLGSEQAIYSHYYNTSYYNHLRFGSNDQIEYYDIHNGTYNISLETNRKFRDTSAWYHIVVRIDTTQSTEADRVRLYINGVQETSFATMNYPSHNATLMVDGGAGYTNHIGQRGGNVMYFDGYMAEFFKIQGTSYAPTEFGEFDSDTGIWKPKEADVTFGSKGVFLDFENSSSLGADVSGNGNNFTVNNLTSIDQTTDTCTNNFATINPLDNFYFQANYFKDGNLHIRSDGSSYSFIRATFGVSTGKWYWEVEFDAQQIGAYSIIGIESKQPTSSTQGVGDTTNGYGYYANDGGAGRVRTNNGNVSPWTSDSYAVGDIVGVALDLDNNKLYFSKNGTFLNSGDPTSGSTGTGAVSITDPASTDSGFYFPAVTFYDSTGKGTFKFNFGNPMETISSGNSDGNGYGNFEYSVPSGYFALCTKNLAEYG